MLRPLWLLLFSAQLTAASVNAADLHLSLSAAKVQYRAGEAVVVRVLVNNPLESDRIWYLKRSFWPVPYSTPMDGDLGLILHVFAPSGRYLSPTRPSMTLVRMKTEQSQFKRLFPGEVFGTDVALDGQQFQFEMKAPGTYRVSAEVFAAGAREWFDGSLQRGEEPHPTLVREQLFDGSIYSSALDVEVIR